MELMCHFRVAKSKTYATKQTSGIRRDERSKMLYDIDLRVAGVEWLLQAFKRVREEENLFVKALLGLTLSLKETGSPEEQELLAFLKESPKLLTGAKESPCKKGVARLEDDLKIYLDLQPQADDPLGEILDMEYRLINRYLVLCFAAIYDSCETGGVELELGEELAIFSYRLANKLTFLPNTSLSIGHLDHMLREPEEKGLLKAIKWLTSRARHQW